MRTGSGIRHRRERSRNNLRTDLRSIMELTGLPFVELVRHKHLWLQGHEVRRGRIEVNGDRKRGDGIIPFRPVKTIRARKCLFFLELVSRQPLAALRQVCFRRVMG